MGFVSSRDERGLLSEEKRERRVEGEDEGEGEGGGREREREREKRESELIASACILLTEYIQVYSLYHYSMGLKAPHHNLCVFCH